MARIVNVTTLDDLCLQDAREVEADQTVTVGLNGRWWAVDLTDENYYLLSALLMPYITAGRKPGNATVKARKAPGGGGNKGKKYDTRPRSYYAELRAWVLADTGSAYDTLRTSVKKELKARYDNHLKGITS